MISADLITLITGPFGALVLVLLGFAAMAWGKLIAPFWALSREMERVDKLDQIADAAMAQTGKVVESTSRALVNHERIFKNQQEILDLLHKVIAEQQYAKEREDWKDER